ncbi:MAG: hypothetical protein KID00_12410 [Clostridium argentinense]|nr:hypothetical protein [Clostridium argentinense]
MMAEILWLKQNGYKSKEISNIIEDNYKIDVKKTYISSIGVYKWIHIDAKYSSWMDKYIKNIN